MKVLMMKCKDFWRFVFTTRSAKDDDDDWMDEHSTYGVEGKRP
jgi:hypothetical protein